MERFNLQWALGQHQRHPNCSCHHLGLHICPNHARRPRSRLLRLERAGEEREEERTEKVREAWRQSHTDGLDVIARNVSDATWNRSANGDDVTRLVADADADAAAIAIWSAPTNGYDVTKPAANDDATRPVADDDDGPWTAAIAAKSGLNGRANLVQWYGRPCLCKQSSCLGPFWSNQAMKKYWKITDEN